MGFPNLQNALSPSRLASYHGVTSRLTEAKTQREATITKMSSNPFYQFTPEQLGGWQQALIKFDELTRSSSEISKQKGAVVISYSQLLEANSELKTLDAFYASALDKVTETFLSKQEEVLTKAYKYIYSRDKEVRLSMEEVRGKKTIKLTLLVKDGENEYEEDTDDEGYSAQTTLGAVLLVHFIVSSDLPRIIFFDETLSGYEDGSLERFMFLLHEFRDTLGFHFVIVTHDRKRLEQYADKMYYVDSGRYSEMKLQQTGV